MKQTRNLLLFPEHPVLKKFFRVMKCTVAILLIICLQASANGFSQNRITLHLESAEMKKVLAAIEKKSNFRFLYKNSLLAGLKKVNVSADNEDVQQLLNRLFINTGLSYEILANNLVVLKPTGVIVADITITGKVTSSTGEPVIGATVAVKGTNIATSTDENGDYRITAPDNATLEISSVGFDPQEIKVNNQTTINVKMNESTGKNLDEVVVIGYGTASKRDLTGSIVKISGREVADKPNANPVTSLQGKVAGLQVTPYGTPGKAPDIRIRGTISIGSVRPLYVVDGILQDNIDYINSNDIESIEILKDPSSLAIFGVRGAAGVIAVTTKRAKSGQVAVNFNASAGAKKLVDKISVLTSGEQFKMLYEEEKQNIGATQPFDYTPWTSNTDWIDALTQTGAFYAANLSVTASTDRNKMYLGLGYLRDEGIVRHEKLEKLMLNFSDEFKVSKAIKLGFNFAGTRQELPYDGSGALADARRIAPIVSAGTQPYQMKLYGADSAIYDLYSALPAIQNTLANPLMVLENNWDKNPRIEFRTVGSVWAEINFLRNLTFRTTFYGDMSHLNETRYTPLYGAYDPSATAENKSYIVSPTTAVFTDEKRWRKFQQDYILTYKKDFGEHGITATAGWTTYYTGHNSLHGEVRQSETGDPIPNDDRFWYVSNGFGDAQTQRSSSYASEATTASALFRVLYNYQGKYMVNGSFRRDGTSYFPNNTWDNFWAIGAAWEVSKEDFMANQKIFDYLKIKGSMGVLGNQNTYGYDYPYYPALLAGNTAVFGNSLYSAYSQAYLPDPNIGWEHVHSQEIGVEFNTFNNRLHFEAVYYNKETKDVLTLVPGIQGTTPGLANFGDISNKGFELLASWSQTINKDFSFNISGNLTTFDNKVERLANTGYKIAAGETNPNQTEAGYPIGYFYGYQVEGIYQSYADKLKSPTVIGYEYGPGDLKYRDINNDGQITTDDRTMIGNPTPDFQYGFSLNANWKGFDIGIDFNGVYGNEVYRIWGSSELPYSKYNYPTFKLDRWHGEGTSNWVPRLGDKFAINRLPSTFGIEDGSYLRIRNLQVGYNIPTKTLQRAYIKSFRIYANVQNLKTWKNNSGYSPEFGGDPNRPALSFGLDNGDGPLPLIFTGGINVNF